MRTRASDRPGVGEAAKLVAERARSIVRLELQLAAAELKQKVSTIAIGIALLVAAIVFGLFLVAFILATITAAIATVVSPWLALLIMAAALTGLTAGLAVVGISMIRKGTPPLPEQALEEARLTAEAVKNGH
jgi:hypothetical protein